MWYDVLLAVLTWVGAILGVLAVLALLFWLLYGAIYVKTSPNMAFVRTGWGGRRVVIDGGAPVLFRLHELRWIPLETIKLELFKGNRDAFITKDRYRVDIGAQFYVRINPEEASVERASRSLGDKAVDPEAVHRLVEEKLVSALRAIVASTTLEELHESRNDFARRTSEAVVGTLAENGLSLESVSLFHLDQTRKDMLDPNNVFDAVGLKRIAAVTAQEARERNEIERNNEVAITRKNVETHKQQLDLELERDKAVTLQRKNVETDRLARQAETEQFRIAQDETVRRRDIAREQQIREAEIQREIYLLKQQEEHDKAAIERETEAQATRIRRERDVRLADIERELAVEIARREMEIQLRDKEKARALAEASRLEAEASRERAVQQVLNVTRQLEAERDKQLALIHAAREVEVADYQARARERLALAVEKEGEATAAARRQLFEAENLREVKVLYHDVAHVLAVHAPEILRELMEPARHIDSIRILDLSGNGRGPTQEGLAADSPWLHIARHVIGAGLAVPFVKELMEFSKLSTTEDLKLLLDRLITSDTRSPEQTAQARAPKEQPTQPVLAGAEE